MGNQVAIKEATFLKRYCKKYQCSTDDFEKSVLWRCLRHASTKPLARAALLVKRDFFKIDMVLISRLKDTTSYAEAHEIVTLYSMHSLKRNILRDWFNIRISRRKLLSLSNSMLNDEEE